MKLNRIFLACACLVVALVGIAATTANQKALTFYYVIGGTPQNPTCDLIEDIPPCDELKPVCSQVSFQIFRDKDLNGNCQTLLGDTE